MNSTTLRFCIGCLVGTGLAMLLLGGFHIATDIQSKSHWVVVAAVGAANCIVSLWALSRNEKKAKN